KFATTASALKSVPSWNVMPSSNSNVYVKPSSDASQSLARPGSTAVPSSSNSSNVSKMFFVTLNVSPSVVLDGSSEVESPPRPKTNVPPLPPLSSVASVSPSSPSPPVSSSPEPEQAARTVPIKSNSKINNNLALLNFIQRPPLDFFVYHCCLFHCINDKQQNDHLPFLLTVVLVSYKYPF